MNLLKQLYLILVLLFSGPGLWAQLAQQPVEGQYNNTALTEVLKDWEKRYQVSFFSKPTLDSLYFTGRFDQTPLENALTRLFDNTPFTFSFYRDYGVIIADRLEMEAEYSQDYFINREQELLQEQRAAEILPPLVAGDPNKMKKTGKASIEGFVIDDNTEDVIIGATIFVEPIQLGEASDETGQFSLELPVGEYDLQVQYVGYQPFERKLRVYSDGTLDLKLAREAVNLEEVVVEAQAPDENVTSTAIGVERLNITSIKKVTAFLGEVDVVKSLLSLPGVSTVGEGAGGFNVRGGTVDQNLIMQDGAILFNTSHVLGFFFLFNPDMGRSVTLSKGSISSRYGGRLSSVLDVELKEGNFREWTGKGGLGIVASRLVLEGPIRKGRSSIIVGGRSSYSDWILRSVTDPDIRKSSAFFYDANLKLTQLMGKNGKLVFSGYSSYDRFRFASEFAYDWGTNLGTLNYSQVINNKLNASLLAVYSQYESTLSDPAGNNAFDLESGAGYYKIKPNFIYLPDGKQTINAGAELVHYQIDKGKLLPADESSLIVPRTIEREQGRELALYLNDEIELSPSISFSIGLRYSLFQSLGSNRVFSYQEGLPKTEENIIDTLGFDQGEIIEQYSNLEPRASLKIGLGPLSSIKLSYNRTVQYINQVSNTAAVTPIDVWQLSNRHILPQKAHNFSVGFFKNLDNNKWETSLEVYYRDIENILEYKDFAQLLANEHIETELLSGKGRAYGLEVFIKRKVGNVNGWLGYTYSRSERLVDNGDLDQRINLGEWYPANFDKPHDLTLALSIQINKRSNFGINFTYSTGRPTTAPIGKYTVATVPIIPNYSLRNQFRIPDYHRLDISYTLEAGHKKDKAWESSWTLSVYNLYGRKNAYSAFYKQSPFSNPQALQLSVLGTAFPAITYNFRF